MNAKEVLTPQSGEDFIFPVADGTAKLSGRDHEFREPTPRREQPVRSEDLSGELQGEPEGSTFFINVFHIGAKFCFFPNIWMSSTHTARNKPCLR